MKSCIAVSRSRSCAVTRWAGPRNRETPQPRDRKTKSPTPESTWGQIEERIRTCRLFSFFYPGCKRPQINPANGECRPRERVCQTAYVIQSPLPPEHPAQLLPRPFHLATAAVDVVGPLAELFERDGGRLVEVAAVEEDTADDAAEETGRTFVRWRGAGQKDFVDGTGTAVLPEHAALRIDVAEGHARGRPRLRPQVRDGAHVRAPDRDGRLA